MGFTPLLEHISPPPEPNSCWVPDRMSTEMYFGYINVLEPTETVSDANPRGGTGRRMVLASDFGSNPSLALLLVISFVN